MGVLNKTNLMGNCEGERNASNFRYLSVARTNVNGHGHSRVAVVISCNRDRSYFWHYLVSGGYIDFGFASDGADISRRTCFQTGPAVSALGLGRLHHTNHHRPADVLLGSHEDVH